MEEVDTAVTACRSVVQEYWKTLDLGASGNWEQELSTFLEKLDKAGIEEVKKAAQKQYDEWKIAE